MYYFVGCEVDECGVCAYYCIEVSHFTLMLCNHEFYVGVLVSELCTGVVQLCPTLAMLGFLSLVQFTVMLLLSEEKRATAYGGSEQYMSYNTCGLRTVHELQHMWAQDSS